MFKQLASLWNLVSIADTDSAGRLREQVGDFTVGTFQDAAFQWIEAANQASVLSSLLCGKKLSAYVVTSPDDIGDVKVRGVFLDKGAAAELASQTAEEIKDRVNTELSTDLGEEYRPVEVRLEKSKYVVVYGGTGVLATVEVHAHELTSSAETTGWDDLLHALQGQSTHRISV